MSENILTFSNGVAIIVAVVSLVSFLPISAWLIELISHFRVQYAVVLGLGSLIAILGGELLAAVLLAAVGVINFWPVVPFLSLRRAGEVAGFLKLVLINVRMRNRSFRPTARFLAKQNPEIIALVEVDEGWLDALGPGLQARGYQETSLPREDSYGLVIYSKFRLTSFETVVLPSLDTPSSTCLLDINGASLGLLLVHLPPPLSPALMRQRDEALTHVAAWLHGREGNWLVLGDFNLTPWSRQLRAFEAQTGYHSFREGVGILATWPDHFAPLRIPLDHVFGSPGIQFGRPDLGGSVKSDHLPVVVRFQVGEAPGTGG